MADLPNSLDKGPEIKNRPGIITVKIRPVRFPPWAAGARPIKRSHAFLSPKPGTGAAKILLEQGLSGGSTFSVFQPSVGTACTLLPLHSMT